MCWRCQDYLRSPIRPLDECITRIQWCPWLLPWVASYSSNTSQLWAVPICCSQCVPIKVSLGSQHVLASSQCVPQQAPHSSSLYPILLCPTFYSCKLYKWRSHNIFILGLSKAWFKFKFIFCDGPINDAHHKRKKLWTWGSPQLN